MLAANFPVSNSTLSPVTVMEFPMHSNTSKHNKSMRPFIIRKSEMASLYPANVNAFPGRRTLMLRGIAVFLAAIGVLVLSSRSAGARNYSPDMVSIVKNETSGEITQENIIDKSIITPYANDSITLTFPGVEFNGRPNGLKWAKELFQRPKLPQPHNPVVIGNAAHEGMLVYRDNQFVHTKKEVTLIHMENVLFTSDNTIIQDNKYVMLTDSCHPRYWAMFYKAPDSITYNYPCYESAISIGHQHSSDFGHWFLEVLPCYAVIPKEILQSSVVVVPYIAKHVIEGFKFLGVDESQIVAGIEIPVFAKKFYTVDYIICGDLNGFLISNMRRLFVERYGLWKDAPTRYITFNRRNMSRCMANYDEFRNRIAQKWPGIPWEDGVTSANLEEQARYFSTVKFIFTIHGSILANIIFMQDNTAVVDLQMEQWLLSFLWLSAYTGKHIIVGRDPRISWRGLRPNVVDLNYALQLVEAGLRAIQAI